MSMNNQVLIAEHKGKWYVFDNIMAESWSDKNELSITDAKKSFDDRHEAMDYAFKIDEEIDDYGYPNSEYGVGFTLAKDGASVKILDETWDKWADLRETTVEEQKIAEAIMEESLGELEIKK